MDRDRHSPRFPMKAIINSRMGFIRSIMPNTNVHWQTVLTSVISGVILAIAATYFTQLLTIARLEARQDRTDARLVKEENATADNLKMQMENATALATLVESNKLIHEELAGVRGDHFALLTSTGRIDRRVMNTHDDTQTVKAMQLEIIRRLKRLETEK